MNNITRKDVNQWARMGPRPMFGQFMLQIGEINEDLIVMSADLGRSSGLVRFKNQFPEKYISVGISEQNMIGVASGLAKEGYKVFVTSFAPFLSMRASEQIRMNLGYMELGVNLVALGSGLSMGFLGNSHYGLEDIAVMRSIPNLTIYSPADCVELYGILQDINANDRGPTYVRLTGAPGMPNVHDENYNFKSGQINQLSEGEDVLIVATGSMVAPCKHAISELSGRGIEASLVNLHTIKPLPPRLIELIESYDKLVFVEEHSCIGGMCSAVVEQMAISGISKKVLAINLPDRFGPTGTYNYLLDYYGLTTDKIVHKVEAFVK